MSARSRRAKRKRRPSRWVPIEIFTVVDERGFGSVRCPWLEGWYHVITERNRKAKSRG